MRYLRVVLAFLMMLNLSGAVLAQSSSEEGVEMEWIRYEVEDAAQLVDLRLTQTTKGYSGRGYAVGFTNDTGSATFPVAVEEDGIYEVAIGYRAPHGEKYAVFLLNDEAIGNVCLPASQSFSQAHAGKVFLNKGINLLTIEKGWGWYELDYIALRRAETIKLPMVSAEPINPNATPEARALLQFLTDNFGKRIIAGQQEYNGSLMRDTTYIKRITGKEPALLGLDLMDYSPSRVERGTKSQDIEAAIEWHKRGGIVAFTWHWNAPKGLEANGREWWSGFYTDATHFDVAAALADPESEDYQLILRDIDAIALQLKRLQDEGVPVLWRPLHEAEGGWFWWGAKGAEPCKELWKLLYHRLTEHHQLNNLIWVWNSISPEWYPGDEYVDIVSCDIYTQPLSYGPSAAEFERLLQLGERPKIVAMAENGGIPDPDAAQAYGAMWGWFMTWNGDILRDWNDSEHLKNVYNHPLVITLDELELQSIF